MSLAPSGLPSSHSFVMAMAALAGLSALYVGAALGLLLLAVGRAVLRLSHWPR